MEADAVEIRVLGCLIEKQRTTPDAYPLSLNSLRLACNQTTNRDPVVEYEERDIKAALDRMSNRGWTRFASGASSRALKYRHLLDEALGLSDAQLSVLAVLMLRGPQTLGELKQRTERLHRFESIAEVAAGPRRPVRARARRPARAATGSEGGALRAAPRRERRARLQSLPRRRQRRPRAPTATAYPSSRSGSSGWSAGSTSC